MQKYVYRIQAVIRKLLELIASAILLTFMSSRY